MIRIRILTTAAAFTPEATTRSLRSKLGSNALLALHQLLWQAQKLSMTLETPLADSSTNRRRLSRCLILYEKTENSISDPPSSLSDISLSLTHDTQICFNTIEPHHFDKRKEKGDKETSYSTDNIIPHTLRSPIATVSPTYFTNAAPKTITGAINTRHSFKRKAGSASLNEGGKSEHRLEKFRRAD